MLANGVDQFYEIGSGRVLAGTLKRVDRKAAASVLAIERGFRSARFKS